MTKLVYAQFSGPLPGPLSRTGDRSGLPLAWSQGIVGDCSLAFPGQAAP